MKNKFGSGYILEVKLKAGIAHETQDSVEQRMNTLEEYVFSMFPDAVIVERFGLRAQYKIPRNNVKSLALVFSSLEEGKTRNVYVLFFGGVGVGGYGLTQTILCKHYASLYCICQILYGLTLMGCQRKILCLVKTTYQGIYLVM